MMLKFHINEKITQDEEISEELTLTVCTSTTDLALVE